MKRHAVQFIFLLPVLLYLTNCEQPISSSPGKISYNVIPEGSGEIIASAESFGIGDQITVKASPFSGRVFYKWIGEIASFDSIIALSVTEKNMMLTAVFPITVISNKKGFITKYPEKTVQAGEYAQFEIGLNLPTTSSYTVTCKCDSFSDYSYVNNAAGNSLAINIGCVNKKVIKQSEWLLIVQSNTDSTILVHEPFSYDVSWQ